MGLLGKIWVKLGLDNSEFNKEIKESQGAVGNFKSFLGGIGKTIAAAFSITAIINFAKASVQAYNESALAAAKLESVLRSTGGASGLTAKELASYAGDLQKVTKFEDDATINAMALLATFKSIRGDIFKQTIASAQDLATVLGTDLNGAVMQLGKALEAPEIGLTMLRRSGISFSTQQIEQIKQLVSEGRKHEAQILMLAEVQTQFGGAAKAAGDTAAGSWVKMKNALGDLMEVIGSASENSRGLAGSLQVWFEQLNKVLSSTNLTFWQKLTAFLGGNQAAFRKANEEFEQNIAYNKQIEAQAEAVVSSIKTIADAEHLLATMSKTNQSDTQKLIRQKLESMIKTYNQTELQKQLDKEAADEAVRKASAEKAAAEAEERHITGSAKNLQYLIKLKQEEINLTTDESKRAALNQELANLEHRLAVMKLTTAELKAYNNLIERGKTTLPAVNNTIIGPIEVQNQSNPFKATTDQGREAVDELESQVDKVIDLSKELEQAITYGISDSIQALVESIVSTGEVDAGAAVAALVSPFGDMLIRLGEVALMSAVGIEGIKAAFESMNPALAAAAGVALIALGSLVKAGVAQIGKSGGKSSGMSNTSFTGGSYIPQPAVASANGNDVMAVIKGEDIWLINKKVDNRKGR